MDIYSDVYPSGHTTARQLRSGTRPYTAAAVLFAPGGERDVSFLRPGHNDTTMQPRAPLSRRQFLGLGAAAAAAALVPGGASAAASTRSGRSTERVLSFFHTHTGERLKVAYCCDGRYQPDALKQINHLLRDFRMDEVKPIDPKLLDLLHELGGTLGTDQPYHVISGYRSPMTNAMLRERGGSHTGVASKSLHMVGKAIDIRLPGVRLDNLRSAARSLQLGGVGYYPSSNFVHVDTGRVRHW